MCAAHRHRRATHGNLEIPLLEIVDTQEVVLRELQRTGIDEDAIALGPVLLQASVVLHDEYRSLGLWAEPQRSQGIDDPLHRGHDQSDVGVALVLADAVVDFGRRIAAPAIHAAG